MLKSLTTIAALLLLMGCARYRRSEKKAHEGCQKAYNTNDRKVAADKCFETSIREWEEAQRVGSDKEIPNALEATGFCADGGAGPRCRNGADRLSDRVKRRHVPPPRESVKADHARHPLASKMKPA